MNSARLLLARGVSAATIVVLFASAACGGSGSEAETDQITQTAEARLLACTEASGIITTLAGSGAEGADDVPSYRAAGDGGPATKALLDRPGDLAMDASGNLYINEDGSHDPLIRGGCAGWIRPGASPPSSVRPQAVASPIETPADSS